MRKRSDCCRWRRWRQAIRGCFFSSRRRHTRSLCDWSSDVCSSDLRERIAQEKDTGDVMMFAWMIRVALAKTAELGRAVYFSRSRNKLWFKGEESGHVQTVHEVRIDCDNDVVLLKITQTGHEPGIACHTGRHSCFYSVLRDGQWQAVDPVLKDPESIYK